MTENIEIKPGSKSNYSQLASRRWSEQLMRLLKDVAISANGATTHEEAFVSALTAVTELTGWKVSHAFVRTSIDLEEEVELVLGPADPDYLVIRRATVEGGFDPLTGLTGRVFASGVAEWIEDLLETMTVIGTQLGRVVERERGRRLLVDRDAKLLAAQRIAGLGYWEWNPITSRLLWTDQLYRLYGLSPDAGIDYEKYLSLIHEDDREGMVSVIEKAMEDHQPYYHVHRITRPDGSVRYIQGHGEVLTDRRGRVVKMYGTGLDVTTLKRAEIDLQLLQERTRALTDSAVEAIVTIDEQGMIVGWNDSATRVFGYEQSEVEGGPLTMMMPERYHDAHEEGLRRVSSAGEKRLIGKTIEIEGRRKSGEEFPIELSLSMWEVAGETFFGGIIRDISERKRVERELVDKSNQLRRLAARLQKVREEERTRLSREVHDLLGQSLTGLRMDIAMLEKCLEAKNGAIQERLDTMKGAIDETVQVVRRISSDLRPGVLDDLGIQAALEWELSKFEHRTGLRCTFDDLTESTLPLDANQSTAIFRVFQELLTNVARHANAGSVSASIEEDEGRFVMIVEDDGVGIRAPESSLTKSLGVLGMRERLAPWGGEIEFVGAPGGGTRVSVTLPLHANSSNGR